VLMIDYLSGAALFFVILQLWLMGSQHYRAGWWAAVVACFLWAGFSFVTEYIIKGWLIAHGVTALLAKRGTGKSTIALDLGANWDCEYVAKQAREAAMELLHDIGAQGGSQRDSGFSIG